MARALPLFEQADGASDMPVAHRLTAPAFWASRGKNLVLRVKLALLLDITESRFRRLDVAGARRALVALRGSLRAAALTTFVVLASCVGSVKHDETRAANRAIEFARFVFIEKNIEKGYELLSDGGKRHLSREKLKETVARMHPRTLPTKVTATEFQPMPGEKAIWIFLAGQNAEEQFQYRLTMEGTENGDYKVLTFDTGVVGRMFSPLSDRQPFKSTITTQQ